MKIYAVYSSDGAYPHLEKAFKTEKIADAYKNTYRHLTSERLSVVPIEVETAFKMPEFVACEYKKISKSYEFFDPCRHTNNEVFRNGFIICNIPFNTDVKVMKKFVDEQVEILRGKND